MSRKGAAILLGVGPENDGGTPKHRSWEMVRHHAYTLRQHLRPCVLSVKRRLTLDVTARVTRIGGAEPQNKEGESWTIITGRLSESIRQSCAMPVAVADEGRDGDASLRRAG